MKKRIPQFIWLVLYLDFLFSTALLILFGGFAVTALILNGLDAVYRMFDDFLQFFVFSNVFIVTIGFMFWAVCHLSDLVFEKFCDFINKSELSEKATKEESK